MLNAVYCEFLKLKRVYFLIGLLVGILTPAAVFMKYIKTAQPIVWNDYLLQTEMSNFMSVFIFAFVMIAAYVFSREFTDNTACVLYSYPLNRMQIFMCKLIIIILIMIFIYIVQFSFNILGGLIVPHEELTKEIVFIHLKINVYSFIFSIALVPITAFIGLISKNMIVPSVYGVFLIMMNVAAMNINDAYVRFIPSVFPAKVVFDNFGDVLPTSASMITVSKINIIMAIITFAIGAAACGLYYLKEDI